MKLHRTDIEYAINPDGTRGYGWNIYPGCLHKPQGKCPVEYCWAESMWKRQMGAAAKRGITLPDFHHPHLIPELLLAPLSIKKPSVILINFMGDLFGDWVDPDKRIDQTIEYTNGKTCQGHRVYDGVPLKRVVLEVCELRPQHTFIFLTKNPGGLAAYSPFPENCWVGVSATLPEQIRLAFKHLHYDVQAKVKFVSFEPMLGMILPFESKWFTASGVNWVIIGQQTPVKTSTTPKIEWVRDMVDAADRAGVPVFLKDNLRELFRPLNPDDCTWAWREGADTLKHLRQEWPKKPRSV